MIPQVIYIRIDGYRTDISAQQQIKKNTKTFAPILLIFFRFHLSFIRTVL